MLNRDPLFALLLTGVFFFSLHEPEIPEAMRLGLRLSGFYFERKTGLLILLKEYRHGLWVMGALTLSPIHCYESRLAVDPHLDSSESVLLPPPHPHPALPKQHGIKLWLLVLFVSKCGAMKRVLNL